MTKPQLNLFEQPPAAAPAGLVYATGFISADDEAALASNIGALPFKPFEFHGRAPILEASAASSSALMNPVA